MIFSSFDECRIYVDKIITYAKSKDKTFTGFFDAKFNVSAIPYEIKKFFEEQFYTVTLHECKQCGSYEMIFSWSK